LLVSTAEAQKPADTLKHYLGAMIGDITGQVSLDVRYITFVDWSTGNLAVHEIATGKNRHLTWKGTWLDSDDYALGSRISSDSRNVAYAWYNREAQRDNEPDFYELRVVGIDGAGERLLYGEQAVDVRPLDWSPDGRRVLASLKPKDGPYQLGWVPLAAGDVQVVKSLADHSPLEVRCSPDGRYIAYDYPPTDDSANRDIFLLASDGSDETVLVAHPEDDRVLDWTPDGKRLLFVSGRTGSPGSWIVQVADGRPRSEPELVYPDVPGRGLGFTRDGAYYYCCGPADQPSASHVYLVDRNSKTGRLGKPEKLIESIAARTSVAWSPDGRQLVYVNWDTVWDTVVLGGLVFVLRSLESGEERQIRPGIGRAGFVYPQWTPDGRSLIAQGRNGLYRIDIQSGEADAILEVEECCSSIMWSLSSPTRRVFFTRWRSERRGEPLIVAARDLESGRETELHRVASPVTASNLSASPDGRWLAFIEWDMDEGTASLKVMPAKGGELRDLLAFSKVRFYRKPRVELTWTPDSRHIVYALSSTAVPWSPEPEIRWLPRESGEEDDFELWQVPVEGGEPERLVLTMKGLIPYGLSISPDGRRIAFTAGSLSLVYDPIWALEDFLPPLPRRMKE
jgi:Tol biopolymer transport system component